MDQIPMPQLGETVTEGTIVRWLKQVGDPVAVDDPLFEVSTDKVDTEVPSAHRGYIRAILVPEGDTVPIGTPVALMTTTADEPVETVPLRTDRPAPPARPARTAASASAPLPAGAGRDVPRPLPRGDDGGVLSPVVRRLLVEHRLDAGQVVGSGRHGRITRSDVLAAAANRRTGPADGPGGLPLDQPRTGSIAAPPGPDDEVIELSRARRATAASMVRSRSTAVHALIVTDVDYTAVDRARRAAGLSYLPYVVRSVVDAIRTFPEVNASLDDERLIVHRPVHLGVAVDLDFTGLVVPVVRDAGGKRLRAIADEMTDLAARARAKRLSADELAGATFTITNVGSYGTLVSAPIINQPQVAILSTDGVAMRPVAVQQPDRSWGIAVHPMGNLSLSFDHRAFDGAYAAAFLALVGDSLQTRDWATET